MITLTLPPHPYKRRIYVMPGAHALSPEPTFSFRLTFSPRPLGAYPKDTWTATKSSIKINGRVPSSITIPEQYTEGNWTLVKVVVFDPNGKCFSSDDQPILNLGQSVDAPNASIYLLRPDLVGRIRDWYVSRGMEPAPGKHRALLVEAIRLLRQVRVGLLPATIPELEAFFAKVRE